MNQFELADMHDNYTDSTDRFTVLHEKFHHYLFSENVYKMLVDFKDWKNELRAFFEFQKNISTIPSLNSLFCVKIMDCTSCYDTLLKLKAYSVCVKNPKKTITPADCDYIFDILKTYKHIDRHMDCVELYNHHKTCDHVALRDLYDEFKSPNTNRKSVNFYTQYKKLCAIDEITSFEWPIINALFLQITNTKMNKFKKTFYNDLLNILDGVTVKEYGK